MNHDEHDDGDSHLEALLTAAVVGASPTPDGWDAIVADSARHAPAHRRAVVSAIAAAAAAIVLITLALTSHTPSDQDLYIGRPPATEAPATSAPAPTVLLPEVPETVDPRGRLLGMRTGLTVVIFDGVNAFDAIDLDTGAARKVPSNSPVYAQNDPANTFATVNGGRIATIMVSEGRTKWVLLPLDLATPDFESAPREQVTTNTPPGGYGMMLYQQGGTCPSYVSYAPERRSTVTIGADAAGACNRLRVTSTPPDGRGGLLPGPATEYPIGDVDGQSPVLVLVSPDGHKVLIGESNLHTQVVDLERGTVTDTGVEPLGGAEAFRGVQRFWSPDSRYIFEYRMADSPNNLGAALGNLVEDRERPGRYTDVFGATVTPNPAQLIVLDTKTRTWAATSLPLGRTSSYAAAIVSATGPTIDATGAPDCPSGPPIPAGTPTVTLSETPCLLPPP